MWPAPHSSCRRFRFVQRFHPRCDKSFPGFCTNRADDQRGMNGHARQKAHTVIGSGSNVLDLGCSPGAWLQVATVALGAAGGSVLGVDLKVGVPTDARIFYWSLLHVGSTCCGRGRVECRGEGWGLDDRTPWCRRSTATTA